MARFCGEVGYGTTTETPLDSGVYVDQITETTYYGDVIRDTRDLEPSDKVNDDISVGNSVSIVADTYAINNFHNIRYVRWMGTAWRVTKVEVRSPRLILSFGGVYNGPTA